MSEVCLNKNKKWWEWDSGQFYRWRVSFGLSYSYYFSLSFFVWWNMCVSLQSWQEEVWLFGEQ